MICRSVVLALAMSLLAACSGVQLAYRNADLLIAGYAEDWLDLDDDQVQAWRPVLDDMLARHRQSELPALVALLAVVRRGAAEGFTDADFACVREHAWRRWQAGAALLADGAAPLLAGLRPAQVQHLRERLRERDQTFREEHLAADPHERHAARVARTIKRIERWTGRLDGQQRALVESHVDTWPPLAQDWHEYRTSLQTRLLAMLETGADAPRLREFLVAWWVRQADMPSTLLQQRDRVQAGIPRLLIDLQATLGREQREQLVAAIDDFRVSLGGLLSETELVDAMTLIDCGTGEQPTAS